MSSEKETAKGAEAAKEPESFQEQSLRIVRRTRRSLGNTWKLYRQSKIGLVGLAIVIGFFSMAAFAPILSPYSVDFKAPATDIFVADNELVNLTAQNNWTRPMGLLEGDAETMKNVMVYSQEGLTNVFPVSVGTQQNIVLGAPDTHNLPPNCTYIEQVLFQVPFFFVLEGNILHEYTYNLQDSMVEYQLPFVPIHRSNLWNAYSTRVNQERMALVFANETTLYLIDKRPNSLADPGIRTYNSTVTIPDARIIGNPLVVDSSDFNNGSMVIVPTDIGLMAYDIDVTHSGLLVPYVSNIELGARKWLAPYAYNDTDKNNQTVLVNFKPVVSENMITFPFPEGAVDENGKQMVIIATTDNNLVAYDRENGTVLYHQYLLVNFRDFKIETLHPSPKAVVVMGVTGERGFIAGVIPETGRIGVNLTKYTAFPGLPNSAPEWVPGILMYVFSTQDGSIYLLNQLMRINATFSAPGGGSATPVAYVGNIYVGGVSTPNTGNYFAVVTKNNRLFVETLFGVDVAPLPPGKYPSGNRYILGTDYEGHDILTWLMYGTRAELAVGVTAALFAVLVGTIVGLVAGFYPGLTDDLLMRATDVVLSLPGLVIMLLFAAVFGPSLVNIIIIIAILSWAGIARVIRSVTLSLKERAFVDAAIIAGASDSRLIFRHIAPNVLPYTFLYMTFTISGAIVTEAILAFLGFGDVNYVTWGMMLQYLQISGHALNAPWWLLPPGLAITFLSLSFYLIGRAFDEVVNPRLRKR